MRLSDLLKKVLAGKSASRPTPARRQAFVPELEALEDRQLLSGYSVSGHTLRITGDNRADIVAITDNGSHLPGNITLKLNADTIQLGDYIDWIVVNTGKGKDDVRYTLSGNLQPGVQKRLWVDLGSGDDIFHANVIHDLIGNGFIETYLDINVHGASGNDTMHVGGANEGIKIGAHSRLDVNLDGGKDHDAISTKLHTTLYGELGLALAGGQDRDTVYANLYLAPGSTGTVGTTWDNPLAHGAYVAGRSGDDTLTFNVINDGSAKVNAEIVGGSGHDSMHSTNNVRKV